ncbi:uncharacterized protein G2W53_030418 [Senna tora]|uniref:Uncharacterized protein n=1 Tax=Senna tora TaxID=362788 RepID=A0A834TFL0_9FABA|nr:uncharacterized protein G2W53_030418 [Senna tora]
MALPGEGIIEEALSKMEEGDPSNSNRFHIAQM